MGLSDDICDAIAMALPAKQKIRIKIALTLEVWTSLFEVEEIFCGCRGVKPGSEKYAVLVKTFGLPLPTTLGFSQAAIDLREALKEEATEKLHKVSHSKTGIEFSFEKGDGHGHGIDPCLIATQYYTPVGPGMWTDEKTGWPSYSVAALAALYGNAPSGNPSYGMPTTTYSTASAADKDKVKLAAIKAELDKFAKYETSHVYDPYVPLDLKLDSKGEITPVGLDGKPFKLGLKLGELNAVVGGKSSGKTAAMFALTKEIAAKHPIKVVMPKAPPNNYLNDIYGKPFVKAMSDAADAAGLSTAEMKTVNFGALYGMSPTKYSAYVLKAADKYKAVDYSEPITEKGTGTIVIDSLPFVGKEKVVAVFEELPTVFEEKVKFEPIPFSMTLEKLTAKLNAVAPPEPKPKSKKKPKKQ